MRWLESGPKCGEPARAPNYWLAWQCESSRGKSPRGISSGLNTGRNRQDWRINNCRSMDASSVRPNSTDGHVSPHGRGIHATVASRKIPTVIHAPPLSYHDVQLWDCHTCCGHRDAAPNRLRRRWSNMALRSRPKTRRILHRLMVKSRQPKKLRGSSSMWQTRRVSRPFCTAVGPTRITFCIRLALGAPGLISTRIACSNCFW